MDFNLLDERTLHGFDLALHPANPGDELLLVMDLCIGPVYSMRSVSTGSSRAARRAGT
jgi:hypothetical protein